MAMSEQPAEPSVAASFSYKCSWSSRYDRFVPETLMWAFVVVVLDILRDQVIQVFPANRDEVIKAFDFE